MREQSNRNEGKDSSEWIRWRDCYALILVLFKGEIYLYYLLAMVISIGNLRAVSGTREARSMSHGIRYISSSSESVPVKISLACKDLLFTLAR